MENVKETLLLLRLFGVQHFRDCHVKSEERSGIFTPERLPCCKNVAVAWENVKDLARKWKINFSEQYCSRYLFNRTARWDWVWDKFQVTRKSPKNFPFVFLHLKFLFVIAYISSLIQGVARITQRKTFGLDKIEYKKKKKQLFRRAIGKNRDKCHMSEFPIEKRRNQLLRGNKWRNVCSGSCGCLKMT